MSIYRQQASIGKKVEVFHQKSSAITSFSSPTAQSAAFNPKHLPSNSMAAKSLEVPGAQSKFISDTMRDLRKEELEVRATKRARTDQLSSADHSTLSKGHGHEKQDSQVACGIEILDEMELHPDTAQLVATSGGLITAWNDTFLNVVKPTNSMTQIPLTIFDLVEPTSLHKLYGMLALALDEEVIVEQDVNPEDATSSSSYMSIIIPVKKFRHTNTKYEMTIVFMEHLIPKERNFLGWIKPASDVTNSSSTSGSVSDSSDDELSLLNDQSHRSHLPRGKILRLDNLVLCQLLSEKED